MSSLAYSKRPRFGYQWMNLMLRIAVVAALVIISIAAVRIVRELQRSQQGLQAPRSTEERLLADARAAVEQDPKSVTARWQLSLALSTVGDYKQALLEGEEGARLGPNMAEPFYALGVAYRGLRDRQRAIKAFVKAASIPNSMSDVYREIYYELGEVYSETRQYKQAVKAFENSLANGPEATYVVVSLAGAYRKAGDKKRAIREYLAVMGYDPTNETAERALKELGVSDKVIEEARNPIAHRLPKERSSRRKAGK